MLIVISIMLILVSLTATMIRPDVEGRRIREAARSINVYFASARNRAIETGRPCGVIFRRFGATASAMTLDQCEVPPSYCGETEQSVASLQVQILGNPPVETLVATLDAGPSGGLVRQYDLIQFNHQGPLYTITNPADYPPAAPEFVVAQNLTLALLGNQNPLAPWTTTPSQPVPYRIFRSPIKGFAAPLQLPAATVVDLGASGAGNSYNWGATDVTIMFSPNGAVECVYDSSGRSVVVEPIFLLVGKRERMENGYIDGNTNESTLTNYQDLNNLWVTINPQTGAVQTEPVAAIPSGISDPAVAIIRARDLAREGLGMGGK